MELLVVSEPGEAGPRCVASNRFETASKETGSDSKRDRCVGEPVLESPGSRGVIESEERDTKPEPRRRFAAVADAP